MTYTAKSKVRTRESSERIKRLDAIYGRVLELRNFEIQNLNTRNTFIWAVNTALFAYAAEQTVKNCLLPILGMIVSILQIGMAAGAKFWQEVWEIKLEEVETELYKVYQDENSNNPRDKFIHLFTVDRLSWDLDHEQELKKLVRTKVDQGDFINRIVLEKFSVSKIPIWLGIVMLIFWFLFLCMQNK